MFYVLFNQMPVCKNLNCISQENLYIKSLFTEMGMDIRLAANHSLNQVNNYLIYWLSLRNTVFIVMYCYMIRGNMFWIEQSEKLLP